MSRDKSENGSPPRVSLLRELYDRVAHQLGGDPSYVNRVVRRERKSDDVQTALSREMEKIFEDTANHDGQQRGLSIESVRKVEAAHYHVTKSAKGPPITVAEPGMAEWAASWYGSNKNVLRVGVARNSRPPRLGSRK
jgi:hypothetical protein